MKHEIDMGDFTKADVYFNGKLIGKCVPVSITTVSPDPKPKPILFGMPIVLEASLEIVDRVNYDEMCAILNGLKPVDFVSHDGRKRRLFQDRLARLHVGIQPITVDELADLFLNYRPVEAFCEGQT